ncbi:hypothetical protein RN001_010904 [Aquatica leii]|uniref:Uncharacterized protein n=1 Tax=Aquatica leii TaxID=1421715 RepID=A0AAN7SNH2_9COLE|nr:hypothetical protein RN001_010904 [Aquatica leii]
MKVLAFFVVVLAAVAAQDDAVDGERILLPCCNVAQQQTAKCNLYAWIFGHYNCDPLFQCIFKCLGVAVVPTGCSPNANLHVQFNLWLLNNYKCLPNSLLQCLKGCIVYNAWPPCPIIGIPTDTVVNPTS